MVEEKEGGASGGGGAWTRVGRGRWAEGIRAELSLKVMERGRAT